MANAESRCVIEQVINGQQTTLYPETKAEYINGLDSKIDTKTAALNTKLTGDINTVNTNLTNKIDTVESTLTTNINTVNTRVTTVNTDLTASINTKASNAALGTTNTNVSTLTTRVDELTNGLPSGTTQTDAWVAELKAGADGQSYASPATAITTNFHKKPSFTEVKDVPELKTPAQQWISEINATGTQAKADMDTKAATTIASIPSDYTTLSNEVTDLKSDLRFFGLEKRNNFDKSTIRNNGYYAAGSWTSDSSFFGSDYIEVKGINKVYFWVNKNGVFGKLQPIVEFYNYDKTYNYWSNKTTESDYGYAIPSGIGYIRVSMQKTYLNSAMALFTNYEPNIYIPYGTGMLDISHELGDLKSNSIEKYTNTVSGRIVSVNIPSETSAKTVLSSSVDNSIKITGKNIMDDVNSSYSIPANNKSIVYCGSAYLKANTFYTISLKQNGTLSSCAANRLGVESGTAGLFSEMTLPNQHLESGRRSVTVLTSASGMYYVQLYCISNDKAFTVSEVQIEEGLNMTTYEASSKITVTLKANIESLVMLSKGYHNIVANSNTIVTVKSISEPVDNTLGIDVSMSYGKTLCIGDSLTDGVYTSKYSNRKYKQNYPYYFSRYNNSDVTNAGVGGTNPTAWYNNYRNSYNFAEYDSFVVWLGTNEGLENNLSSNTNHTAYYKKIIDDIKSSKPDALIFICTIFATSGEEAGLIETNQTIQALASTYSIPVIDMSFLGKDSAKVLHDNANDSHFNKAGYMYIAKRIKEYIDNYINENYLDNYSELDFGLIPKSST